MKVYDASGNELLGRYISPERDAELSARMDALSQKTLSPQEAEVLRSIHDEFNSLERIVLVRCPDVDARRLALTRLREASWWASRAIVGKLRSDP